MVISGFSSSPNGTAVDFTLSATPATGGLVFIVHNGLILKVVPGSSPSVGECNVSGRTIKVGLAPTSGDAFWALVQDNLLTSLRRTEMTGDIDNSNQSFTIKTVPSGTNPIIFFNGIACEKVSSGASTNEYTYTTGSTTDTIVFWTYPFRTDRIEAYTPVKADAATATFAFTGDQDGINADYTLTKTGQMVGDISRMLTVMNGILLEKQPTLLAANTDWMFDNVGEVVSFNLLPLSGSQLAFYSLGAEEQSWDTLITKTQNLIDDEDGLFHDPEELRKFLEQAELFITIFRVLGERTGNLSITNGTATYKIHDTFADFIAPLRITINNLALRETHIAQLKAVDASWYTTTGTPEFFYMIGGQLLGFYPAPNTSFTAKITRLAVPDGAVDKYAPPSVDAIWHNVLPLYASCLALTADGKANERTQGLMQQFMDAVGLPRDRRFMAGEAQREAANKKIVDQRRSAND